MASYFDGSLFQFLRDLKKNNKRTWFEANKARYLEALREPALRFISDAEAPLLKISGEFRADPRPSGGSLFRIYQDQRFHKNKAPYKTHVGIRFLHRDAKDVHAPVYYLHLAPDECFVALGLWRPAPKVAQRLRQAIWEQPKVWNRAVGGTRFVEAFALGGESLKRVPAFDGVKSLAEDDPLLQDLKRKDFIARSPMAVEEVLSPKFLPRVFGRYRRGTPFMKFLCEGIGLDF